METRTRGTMLKNIVRIEFQIVDRVYHFLCDNDSPIEHIKEAIFQMQKYIGQVEDNVKAQLAAQKEAEEKKPEDDQKVEE
jgi:hypothetical protein